MSRRSTRRIQPSQSASPDRSSPVGSLLGSPTLGVSRLVLAEDALQGGSVMRIPRLRDSVGERAASSINPAQPDDDTEGSAKGPRPMPKRKRSKSENQSNQERHSPRRRPPAWVGALQGGEEDAALRADGEMDELEMLREQQEMQSLEIGMMMKFQERRDEEETARSQEQLELIREEQARASEQVDVIYKVQDVLNPRGARGAQPLPAAAVSPVTISAHEEEGEEEQEETTHSSGSSRRKKDPRVEQASAQARRGGAAARGWAGVEPSSRGVNRLFKSNAVMDEFQPSKK